MQSIDQNLRPYPRQAIFFDESVLIDWVLVLMDAIKCLVSIMQQPKKPYVGGGGRSVLKYLEASIWSWEVE